MAVLFLLNNPDGDELLDDDSGLTAITRTYSVQGYSDGRMWTNSARSLHGGMICSDNMSN